jgi:hypothetical protein
LSTDILTKTEGVIGDDRTLRFGYGTTHPKSIVEHDGRVWFFDMYKSEIVRYDNGLFPLGQIYKCKKYLKQKASELISNGGEVVGGYDPVLQMVFMTFTIDGESETIGFLDRPKYEGFIGNYDFTPEMFARCGDKWYGFKNGAVWEHNASATHNNFYGTQGESEISFVFNEQYNKNKILWALTEESTDIWLVTECTNPNGQSTRVPAESWFSNKNNAFEADWLMDENTNPLLIPGRMALISGERMEGRAFDITIENDSTEEVTIDAFTNVYSVSGGQATV